MGGDHLGGAVMPDFTLHANNERCPACELRLEAVDTAMILRHPIQCQVCNGSGLLPLPTAEIVRRTCEEARRIYWPQFEARIAAQNGERA